MTKKGKIVPHKAQAKESRIHRNCVQWFDLQYPKLSLMMFHIPNGGARNIIEAMQFKRMGVRAGVADMFLSIPNETTHGLYIEFKNEVGKQSPNQKHFMEHVMSNGYGYIIIKSVEEFICCIQEHLKTTPHRRHLMVQMSLKIAKNNGGHC